MDGWRVSITIQKRNNSTVKTNKPFVVVGLKNSRCGFNREEERRIHNGRQPNRKSIASGKKKEKENESIQYQRLTFRGGQSEPVGHLVVLLLEFADALFGAGQLDGHGRVVSARQVAPLRLHKLGLLLQHQLERVETLQLDDALLFVLRKAVLCACGGRSVQENKQKHHKFSLLRAGRRRRRRRNSESILACCTQPPTGTQGLFFHQLHY